MNHHTTQFVSFAIHIPVVSEVFPSGPWFPHLPKSAAA